MQRGDERALQRLRDEVTAVSEPILFDARPNERDAYMRHWGCAAWTQEALACIAERGPIIELGAGTPDAAASATEGSSTSVLPKHCDPIGSLHKEFSKPWSSRLLVQPPQRQTVCKNT